MHFEKQQDMKQNGFKTIQTNSTLSEQKNVKLEALKKLAPNLINSDNQLDINALADFLDDCSTDKLQFVSTSNNKGYELTFAGKGIARAKADTETEFELKFEPTQSKIPHQVRNDKGQVRNDDNRTVIAGDDPQSQPQTQGHCGLKPAPTTNTQGHCGLKPAPTTNTQSHCGLKPDPTTNTQGHCGLDPQSQNTVIRGDNLEVLKILKQNYFENIKMIYIDPPYNTKSENFIYNDNFKQNEEELIENFGLDENTTNFLQNVYGTRSHSGWLAFMYPRLKLARDLLKEDGVIFISIDDNEQANLKIMCDEIFGEENFVGQWNWYKSKTPPNLSKKIKKNIEYILCYEKQNIDAKYKGLLKKSKSDDPFINATNSIKKLCFPENSINVNREFKKGVYGTEKYPNKIYNDLFIKNGKNKNSVTFESKFRWTQEKLNEELKNGTIINLSVNGVLSYKKKNYDPEVPPNFISAEIGDTNENASNYLISLFEKKIFDYPKPTSLIKYLINFICDKNDLILDFFAGSGTTGDAVMQLNAEDGGNRKFILVQWDETIKKNTEAYQFCIDNNFEPVIPSITIERLNRAGERLRIKSAMTKRKGHSVPDTESLFKDEMADQVRHEDKQKVIAGNDPQSQPHAQSHCGLDPQSQLDIGYKVFSLTQKPKLAEQGGLFRLVNERKTTADTLYNMLCATGKPLHKPFTELIKDRLYLVEEIPHQVRNDNTQSHCGLDPQSQKYLYVLGEISPEQWETVETKNFLSLQETQIYIDGYSDISLENWLNLFGLNEKDKEQVTVVY